MFFLPSNIPLLAATSVISTLLINKKNKSLYLFKPLTSDESHPSPIPTSLVHTDV